MSERTGSLKLMYILWDGGVGGAASNLADFVRRVSPGRYDITVCLLSSSGATVDSMLGPGVRAVEMRARRGWDATACIRLIQFCRSHRFDVIHNNAMTPFCHVSLVLGARGVPRLYQEHGDVHTHGDVGTARVFYRLCRGVYNQFVTVSDYTRQVMVDRGVSPRVVVDIGNPIDGAHYASSLSKADAKRRLGLPSDRPVVGTACRLVYQKDLPLFLQAARATSNLVPNVSFAVVGSGKEEARLREMARELGIGNVVHFLGSRTEMAEVYRSFDVFLLTSRGESFGRVILESLASGVPIVGVVPEFGGGRQLFEEAHGVLRTYQRDGRLLGGLAADLLRNPNWCDELGRAGRDWVAAQSQFQVDQWVGRLESVYQELVASHGRHGHATCRSET